MEYEPKGLDEVWDVVERNLPDFKGKVEAIL